MERTHQVNQRTSGRGIMTMKNTSKKHARRWGAGMIAAGLLLGGGVLPAGINQADAAASQAKAVSPNVVLKVR